MRGIATQLLRKFSKMSVNYKTFQVQITVLAIRLENASSSRREHNRSRIWYRLSASYKIIREVASFIQFFDAVNVLVREDTFRVSNSNSSTDNIENSEYTIFDLSLSRYDANLSKHFEI